jgi:hypothetical protein
MRDPGLVIDDRSGLRPHFCSKGERIGFQRQRLALRTDDVELVVIADFGVRDEQLPIANAAHAHRMAPRVPEVEIADHADPPRIGRQHHKSDASDAIQCHKMRAKLVVHTLIRAFAE